MTARRITGPPTITAKGNGRAQLSVPISPMPDEAWVQAMQNAATPVPAGVVAAVAFAPDALLLTVAAPITRAASVGLFDWLKACVQQANLDRATADADVATASDEATKWWQRQPS